MKTTGLIVFLFLNICFNINVSISASIRHKRDLKSDLIANSKLLLSRAHSVVTELKQQNRTQEALTIEMYANLTENVTEKLNSSKNETEIIELQRSLSKIKEILSIEIERAGLPSFSYEGLKLPLIIYGEELIERAVREIDNLNKRNNTEFVVLLDTYVKVINQIINELKNASLIFDVYDYCEALSEEITNLERDLYGLGVVWDLENVVYIQLDRANNLIKQFTAAINNLKISEKFQNLLFNRTELINDLESHVQELDDISRWLRKETVNHIVAEYSFRFLYNEIRIMNLLTMLNIESVGILEREILLNDINEFDATLEAWKSKVKHNYMVELILTNAQDNLNDLRAGVKIVVKPLDFAFFEYRVRSLERTIKFQLKDYLI